MDNIYHHYRTYVDGLVFKCGDNFVLFYNFNMSYHLCLGLASGLMCSGFPIEFQYTSSDKQLHGSYSVLHSETKFACGSGRRY